ncbi:Linear gramicidin synthase subunit A [compost metagenome]
MCILWLGPKRPPIHDYLKSLGEEILYYDEVMRIDSLQLKSAEFIVSYGYRHIIKKDILTLFHRKIINLHISYLPWNRGADPNLWSILEDTPKGVTIHYVDEGLDTGDIIVQKEIQLDINDTLRTSYERLSREIEDLFISNWINIKSNNIIGIPQKFDYGSIHYSKDKKPYEQLLYQGWDTPIVDIIGKK